MDHDLPFLSSELAKIIEAGIERELNQSVFYSPFRLFYRLFKKANPSLIQRVREILADDIQGTLINAEGWNKEVFINEKYLSDAGDLLIKKCYNIGIRLVKNRLSVKLAFKVMINRNLQQEIYNYILNQVKAKTEIILKDAAVNAMFIS